MDYAAVGTAPPVPASPPNPTWVEEITATSATNLGRMETLLKDAVMDSKQRGPYNARPAASSATKNWFWFDTDAAIISYCDGFEWMPVAVSAGIRSVKCVATANLNLATVYAAGALTIDGYVVAAGDRVLVAGQTNNTQNGLYAFSAVAGGFQLVRALEMAHWDQLVPGQSFIVQNGVVNTARVFTVTSPDPSTPPMSSDAPWQSPVIITGAAIATEWRHELHPLGISDVASLNFGTRVADSASFLGGWRQSSGANGDYMEWFVNMTPGVWQLNAMGSSDSNRGRVGVMIDGVDQGVALDYYAATTTRNIAFGSPTFTVTTPGRKRVRCYANGKNGASSAYYLCLQELTLVRTS